MTLEDLHSALEQEATGGNLSFKQIAGKSFAFSLVTNELPFAQDIALKSVTISAPSDGKFTVAATAGWDLMDGIATTITFETKDDDITAQLMLQMPSSLSLSIPGIDWISAQRVSMQLQTLPAAARQNPLIYPVAGALTATVQISEIPVPIKIGVEGGGDWTATGDFERIDFPTLSDVLSFVGNTDGINLPGGLNELTAIALCGVSIGVDPVAKSVSVAGVTLGPSPNFTNGWEVLPGVFTVNDYSIVVNVFNPTDKVNRNIGGSIGAKVTLGGTEFDVSAAHPANGGWDFQGLPKKGETLDFGKLLDDLQSRFAITLPTSLNRLILKDFVVGFDTQTGNAQCTFTLDLNIAATSIELQTHLKLNKVNGKYTPDLKGTLSIGAAAFTVTFNDSGIAAEWSMDVNGQPVKLEDLATAFGFKDYPSFQPPWDVSAKGATFAYDVGKGELDLSISGEISIGQMQVPFKASHDAGGWTLVGKTDDTQAIDFTDLITGLFREFGLDLPSQLPGITLKALDLQYDFSTGNASFTAVSMVPSQVQFGNAVHEIDTQLDLKVGIDTTTGNRTYKGYLRGAVTFGSAVFQGEFDFGAATVLKAVWDGISGSLNFADLAASHGIDHSLQPPGGLALDLTRAAFEYDVPKGRFLLSADSKYGQAFFVTSNANQQWDFAFGILIEPSEIPGFPAFSVLKLENTMLILSTVQDDSFIVPALPGMPVPGQLTAVAPRKFQTIGTTKLHLKPGVSVAAVLQLGNGNAVLKNLGSAAGQSDLLIQASVADMSSISFMAYLDGSISIAGGGNDKLVLSDVFVEITESSSGVGALLSGSVLIPFNQVTLQASGAMAISDVSMAALFQVKAEQGGQTRSLPGPFGLLGVSLDELDIEVAVDFEPPGVDLGIEGKFNIKGQQADANDFTIVLEFVEEVPNPQYLSTHIQELTIAEVITAYSGQEISDAPAFMTALKAEDLSIYWSDSAGTVLPDGTLSQAGFGFDGMLAIGSFTVHAGLTVSTSSGVSGNAQMSPIQLGSVFSLTGNGSGVKLKQALIDGQWQSLTKSPEDVGTLQIREYQVIDPGGATIEFNSKKSPYLDVSAKASLFNFLNTDVEIEISNSGFSWQQKESIGTLVSIEFDCALSKSGFSTHAEFNLNIKGDIGPIEILGINFGTIHLDISFDATLDISIDSQGFTLKVSGSFDFEGASLTMPQLTIHEDFKSFEELPGKILKQIEDEADTIFKDMFDEATKLLNDAKEAAEAIAADAEAAAKAIASGAEQTAQTVVDGAEKAYEAAQQGAADAAVEAKKIDDDAAKIGSDAVATAKDIESAAATEVTALKNQAEAVLGAAETAVTNIEKSISDEVSAIGKAADAAWDAANKEVGQIEADAAAAVTAIEKWATNTGEALVADAKQFATAVDAEVERIGVEIEQKLLAAAQWLEHEAQSVWHEVSKY